MKKIMICCSSSFYDKIPNIQKELEKKFTIIFPNCYQEENDIDWEHMTDLEYTKTFQNLFLESRKKVQEADCCLILNFDKVKNGILYPNYIGPSTFLEMYEAFMNHKEIYLYNDFPDKKNMLYDEIKGLAPTIIHQDIHKISIE